MKHFINLFLAFVLAMSPAHGAVILTDDIGNKLFDKLRFPNSQATRVADKSYRVETGNKNMLVNPSFEDATLLAGWASPSSPGTKDIAAETSRVWDGDKALKVTMTGASSYLLQSVSSAKDFSGTNIEVGIRVATTITGAKLCGRKDGVEIQCVDIRNDNVLRYYYVFMPGNSTSTAYDIYVTFPTSTGSLYFDDAYLGPEKSLVNVTSPNTYSSTHDGNGNVRSGSQTPINWISNCTVTDTSLYTCPVSGGFTVAPKYQIQLMVGSDEVDRTRSVVIIENNTSATQLQFRVMSNVGATSTKDPARINITAEKRSPDYVQPAITPDNLDYNWKSYTPFIAASVGTLPAYTLTYAEHARIGGKLYIRGSIIFTGTNTWASPVIQIPSGLTHTGSSNNVLSKIVLNDQGNNAYDATATLQGGANIVIGSLSGVNGAGIAVSQASPFTWGANDGISWFVGPIDIVGWNNVQSTPLLLQTVYADTAVKAEKSAGLTSVDYGTWTPTVADIINASSVTVSNCSYMRIGNVLQGSCTVPMTCTTIGNGFEFSVTPPTSMIASTVAGSLSAVIESEAGRVTAVTSTKFIVQGTCKINTGSTRNINFMYRTN